MIHHGDCLDVLKKLKRDSIDSLVTDPPAGISFMGKDWDKSEGFIPSMTEIFKECLRVLKPGAHALVWAIPRTSHWTATALEDAGFEIRDVITHLFGSGFPKSLDISKAIDKAAGVEREVIGKTHCGLHHRGGSNSFTDDGWKAENRDGDFVNVTAPATTEAKQWQGFGTALKPASEHWILCRKPLGEKTVAANVLKHGTGGINIDASRIGTTEKGKRDHKGKIYDDVAQGYQRPGASMYQHKTNWEMPPQGRFPANLVLSHSDHCDDKQCDTSCAVAMLDRQSGTLKSGKRIGPNNENSLGKRVYGKYEYTGGACEASSGGASRFFYVAKASKRERNEGCEVNNHPTVKPIKLMRYLIKLITPPSGTVLDPFTGSGSTGVAALKEGFKFVGIEREKEYVEIAKARLEHTII